LLKFFEEFPELKHNDFFITGESYGGMYVPTLVEQIHSKPEGKVNLKGVRYSFC
jgi:carboxypeptidase C (cathepsin A)